MDLVEHVCGYPSSPLLPRLSALQDKVSLPLRHFAKRKLLNEYFKIFFIHQQCSEPVKVKAKHRDLGVKSQINKHVDDVNVTQMKRR